LATSVLVSGAKGFVGSRLVQRLSSDETVNVISLDRHCGDITQLETWLRQPCANAVVHLAARSYVPDSWANPGEFFHTNVSGAINALEYCRRNNARLVFLSSYVYGNPDVLPINELAEIRATNPYMASKKSAEDICRYYAEWFGVPVAILRPFNVYGVGQDGKFLIPTVVRQHLSGEKVTVQDLAPRRDYVYVDDLIEAIVCAIQSKHACETYNIASGTSHSVQDVIELVAKLTGKPVPVESLGNRRPNEVMDTRGDIGKAAALLSWRPRWSLEMGLSAIIKSQQ
jgi:GDP-4-dehydro-6-deoxy-D-mannose reductase